MSNSTQTTDKVFTLDNNGEFNAALARNERCEVDGELFEYYMEVLPPRVFRATMKLVTGDWVSASFGFAEGDGVTIVAFWRSGDRIFAQNSALRTRG